MFRKRNAFVAGLLACAGLMASAPAARADGPLAVTPAVYRPDAADGSAATVDLVRWRGGWGGYGYRGGYGGFYRPYGYGGYGGFRPYGYGYGYPRYGYGYRTYGYGYPAYGYSYPVYSYPAYSYPAYRYPVAPGYGFGYPAYGYGINVW